MNVKRTERGWAGHFCCADRCLFRRNTLLEYDGVSIVISTVGVMKNRNNERKFEEVGCGRYYETMAFHADNSKYKDSDVCREISFDSPWMLRDVDSDLEANEMHEVVVAEITEKLLAGKRYE